MVESLEVTVASQEIVTWKQVTVISSSDEQMAEAMVISQNYRQSGNYGNLLSLFFGKNFMKLTAVLKSILPEM